MELDNSLHQLTKAPFGHTLHHTQIQSKCGGFLVYDTRNDDTKIAQTDKINVLNLNTLASQTLYTCTEANEFGPGVGAATFSPKNNRVLFIHGIKNASENKPYSMTRRTGVAIDLSFPEKPIYMDARNIYPPFTLGALRGGTHSHCWHSSLDLISFTYNDFVLETNAAPQSDIDLRTVGVMFPQAVMVPMDEEQENNSGEMFAVIVAKVTNNPIFGSDEIDKAFDECWLGEKRSIAFQGNVKSETGATKTEIFIVDLPQDLTQSSNPLQGTLTSRCAVPNGTNQYRITNTTKGISSFRHWLRSNKKGTIVYFLCEDKNNITQLHSVEIQSKKVTQLSFHSSSIHSPININQTDTAIVYFVNNKIVVFNLLNNKMEVVFKNDMQLQLSGIPHFDLYKPVIYFNAYEKNSKSNESFLQIFKLDI